MRALLGLRRAAGRARDREAASRWLASYRPSGDEPPARELESVLAEVLRPPRGRLHVWLIRRLAESEGLRDDEIEGLIFPRYVRAGKRS
jgi:hypothetical protein